MTDEKKRNIDLQIQSIIDYYDMVMEDLYEETNPGKIRSKKGNLVEEIARRLVKVSWGNYLEQSENRLKQDKEKKAIKIIDVEAYIQRYGESPIVETIKSKKNTIKYNFGTDNHVYIDGTLVLAIECKSYTESAMLKRIIYDRRMLYEFAPEANYVLLQLESALGGDFALCSRASFGSNQYHVFMSREQTNIDVITLLEGRRDADNPIHRRENGKELKKEHLVYAVEVLAKILEQHI